MVQCDKYDQWYHYDCAAVNSGVTDVSWNCEGCNSNNSEATTSTTSRLGNNPATAYSTGLSKQPQATSSPTTLREIRQLASTIAGGIGNRILPPSNAVATSPVPIGTKINFPFYSQANTDNSAQGGPSCSRPFISTVATNLSI